VLGLVLLGEPEQVTPPGVEVRQSGEEEFEAWLDVVLDGFTQPDTPGVPVHDGELTPEVIAGAGRDFAAAGGIRYIALREGVIAGAAGGCRPRCCRPGSPTPQPPAATSPSLRRCQDPSLSRTCSARASTCSIPAPFGCGNPELTY